MKRTFRLVPLLVIAALVFITPLAHAQEVAADDILILDDSRTGNTRMACEALQKELNARLLEIKDLNDRSGSWAGSPACSTPFSTWKPASIPNTLTFPQAPASYLRPRSAAKLAPAIRTLIAREQI